MSEGRAGWVGESVTIVCQVVALRLSAGEWDHLQSQYGCLSGLEDKVGVGPKLCFHSRSTQSD